MLENKRKMNVHIQPIHDLQHEYLLLLFGLLLLLLLLLPLGLLLLLLLQLLEGLRLCSLTYI